MCRQHKRLHPIAEAAFIMTEYEYHRFLKEHERQWQDEYTATMKTKYKTEMTEIITQLGNTAVEPPMSAFIRSDIAKAMKHLIAEKLNNIYPLPTYVKDINSDGIITDTLMELIKNSFMQVSVIDANDPDICTTIQILGDKPHEITDDEPLYCVFPKDNTLEKQIAKNRYLTSAYNELTCMMGTYAKNLNLTPETHIGFIKSVKLM